MTHNTIQLMGVPELADRLGISLKSAWRLISQRRIGFVRIGRRIVISEVQLSNFIEENSVSTVDAVAMAQQILGR